MLRVVLASLLAVATGGAAVPRSVRISDQQFILAASGKPIVMSGPNVVVKGPPYLPSVSGTTICNDLVNSTCAATGTCTSCETFNEADVAHLKASGWNSIRLGVVWAGAQPRDEDKLDPAFVERLHAVLNLTDREGEQEEEEEAGEGVRGGLERARDRWEGPFRWGGNWN